MKIIAVIEGLLPVITVFGILMQVVPVVDILYGHSPSYWFMVFGAIYALVSFTASQVIIRRRGAVELGFLEALMSYTLVWVIIPLLSSIPLSLQLSIPLVDALFESISGFTGTGLTILRGLDEMSKGILLWRALMQWTGELGVVVFAAVFLPFFWRFGFILYSIERPSRISASLRETSLRIFYMYFLVTAVGIILCIYLGVEPLDAVVHVMTSIATGGMSNYDVNYEKLFEYAPLSIYPITALMIIGGFNFVVLSHLLNGEFRKAWGIEEFRAYIYALATISLLSLIASLPRYNWSLIDGLLHGVFNAISAVTTTGFSIGDIGRAGSSIKLLLILGMFIGSMSFSTAGGIKIIRLTILVKKLKSYVIGYLTGGEVTPDIKLGEEILDEREVSNALFFIVLHLGVILLGAGVLMLVTGCDLLDTLFEATSAASNVGLSVGITSPSLHIAGKIVLMLLMYLGRLEYTALVMAIGILALRGYRLIVVSPR